MTDATLYAACAVTGLLALLLPELYPPIIASFLAFLLFRYEQLEQEQEENDDSFEYRESFIDVGREQGVEVVTAERRGSVVAQDGELPPLQPVQRRRRLSSASEFPPDLLPTAKLTAEDRVRNALSPKQLEMATRLIKKLKADPTFRPDSILFQANFVNARRFLQARDWQEATAEALWRKAVEWRRDFRLTERRQRLRMMRDIGKGIDPEFDFVEKHWFTFLPGRDINNVPAVFSRPGTADPYGLLREIGDTDRCDTFIERTIDVVETAMEEAARLDVLDKGIVEICDVREFKHVPNFLSRAYNSSSAFKVLAKIVDEVYVERIRRVVILGAPPVFKVIWNMAQPLIPKETKSKLFLYAANEQKQWMDCIKKEMPMSNIPQYIGGEGPNDGVPEGSCVPKGSFERFKIEEFSQHDVLEVGLIADVQHSNAEDGFNFDQTRRRRYRSSLNGLKAAVDDWNKHDVSCVIQLGDLIDGTAAKINDSAKAIERCNAEFNRLKNKQEVHHVLGNHDLYNFNREDLEKCLKRPISQRSILMKSKYRFIFLDAYEQAVIGVDEKDENYKLASEFLVANNPNDWRVAQNWLAGLVGVNRRVVPYNGAITTAQQSFLESELESCIRANEYAVIITHIPLQPGSCVSSCLLWNYEEVANILRKYSCSKFDGKKGVVLVLAGHDHDGGYALDQTGIHYVTLPSPLEAPGSLAHGVLKIVPNGMYLKGYGKVKDIAIPFSRTPEQAKEEYAAYVRKCVTELYHACLDNGLSDKTYADCEQVWLEHQGTWDALPAGWPSQK